MRIATYIISLAVVFIIFPSCDSGNSVEEDSSVEPLDSSLLEDDHAFYRKSKAPFVGANGREQGWCQTTDDCPSGYYCDRDFPDSSGYCVLSGGGGDDEYPATIFYPKDGVVVDDVRNVELEFRGNRITTDTSSDFEIVIAADPDLENVLRHYNTISIPRSGSGTSSRYYLTVSLDGSSAPDGYWWRVREDDRFESWSPIEYFQVSNPPPVAPVLTKSYYNNGTHLEPRVSWNSVPEANHYEVEVTWIPEGHVNTYSTAGLNWGEPFCVQYAGYYKQYRVEVRAFNSDGLSSSYSLATYNRCGVGGFEF